MAIDGGRIDYTVGFKTDPSGLKTLQSSVEKIRQLTTKDLININGAELTDAKKSLDDIRKNALAVQDALQKAYNVKLGTYNLEIFKKNLKDSNLSINAMQQSFKLAGSAGQQAMLGVSQALTNVNLQAQKSGSIFDKMGAVLKRTLTWNISSSVINTLTGGIQQAYGYVKNLDSSLNDIRIVTNKSADEMDRFAQKANKAAQALGKSTTDYTNASLIYYQQGLSDEETAARTETTLKAASVTQQSTSAVSEQLTAVWNGYKVSAQEAELYVDKLAAVAADTAADLEELSTGMSKVASAANMVGVDVDQMNAILATTISVTRQAPETVGTAYKTVLARMSTIAAGGTDEEDGATLTSYTEKMNAFGINVLDSNNKLRDMGDVIEEVGSKWDTFSREAQISLAQVMAGTRQYNNLVALFENWDMYTKAIETSSEATGTLQRQQDIYMQSTEAHLQTMTTAAEGVFDSLLDTGDINTVVDGLTSILNIVEDIVDTLGGGKEIIAWLLPQVMMLFSKDIGKGVSEQVGNLLVNKNNRAITESAQRAAKSQELRGNDALVDTYMTGQSALLNAGLSPEELEKRQKQWNRTVQMQSEMKDYESDTVIERAKSKLAQATKKEKVVDKDGNVITQDNKYAKVNTDNIEKLKKARDTITKINDENELMSISQFDEVSTQQELNTFTKLYEEQIKAVSEYNAELAKKMQEALDKKKAYIQEEIKIEQEKNDKIEEARKRDAEIEEKKAEVQKKKEEMKEKDKISEYLRLIDKQKKDEEYLNQGYNALKEKNDEEENTKIKLAELDDEKDPDGSQREKLQNELKGIQNTKKAIQEQIDAAKDANKELADNIVKMNMELGEVTAQSIEELRKNNEQNISEVQKLRAEIDEEEEEIRNLENERDQEIKDAENEAEAAHEKNEEKGSNIEGFDKLEETAQQSYKEIVKVLDDLDATEEEKSKKLAEYYTQATQQVIDFSQQGVESLVEGFTQVGTGIAAATTSVIAFGSGLARIWSDDEANVWEKAAKSVGLFVATLATVGQGIKGVKEGFTAITAAVDFFSAATATNSAITDVNRRVRDANTVSSGTNTASTGANTASQNANTGARTLNLAAMKAQTVELLKQIKALALQAIAWAKSHKAIVIVAAVLAILTAAVSHHIEAVKQQIKAESEAAQKRVEESKKIAEASKQEKDSVDALINSYKELSNQYESGELSLDALRNKTYELCMEYNEQDLALKALVADYESLNDIMKEAQLQSNENYIRDQNQYLEDLKVSADLKAAEWNAENHSVRTGWGTSENNLVKYDFGYGRSSREEQFIGRIENLIGGDESYHSAWQQGVLEIDYEALSKNQQELQALFEEYSDLASHHVYQDIKDASQNLSEVADEYTQAKEALIEAQMQNVTTKTVNIEEIKSYNDYLKQSKELRKELFKVYDDRGESADVEAINEYMEKLFMSSAETAQYVVNDKLVEAFQQSSELGVEELRQKIAELNDSDRNWLYLHYEWIQEGESPEGLLNKFAIVNAYEKDKNIQKATQSAFEKEEISQWDKESFIDQSSETDSDFNEFIKDSNKFSLSDFYAADTADTKAILNEYYVWQEKKEEELKETRLKNLQIQIDGEREALNKSKELRTEYLKAVFYDELEDEKSGTNEQFESVYKNNKELFGSDENFRSKRDAVLGRIQAGEASAFEYLLGMSPEEMTDDQKQIKVLLEAMGVDFANAAETVKLQDQSIASHEEQLNSLISSYNLLSEDVVNYSQIAENANEATKIQIESLSNISDVYSTLKNAVDDFNENNGFSSDTLAKLEELRQTNPEYLEALEKEGDHYVFNEQKLKDIFDEKKKNIIAEQDTIIEMNKEAIAVKELTIAELKREMVSQGVSQERRQQINQEIAGIYSEIDALNKGIETAENYKGIVNDVQFDNSISETFEPDLDPYEDLTLAIEDVNNALSRLQDAQESLTGEALARNLEEQNKLLEERRDLLNQTSAAMEKDLASQRSVLAGYGASFDEDTNRLTNAGALKQQYSGDEESFNKINDLITKYLESYSSYNDILDQLLENSSEQASTNTMTNLARINESLQQASDSLAIVQEEYEKYKELIDDDDLTSEEQLDAVNKYSEGLEAEAEAYKRLSQEANAAIDSIAQLAATQSQGKLKFGRSAAENNANYQEYLNQLYKDFSDGTISKETYEKAKAAAEQSKEEIDKAVESAKDADKALKDINDELEVTKEEAKEAFDEFKFDDNELQMQKLSKELSLLQRQASRLEGPALINNLKKQQQVIQRQIKLQQTKLELQKLELANQKRILLGQIEALKLDAAAVKLQFDKEGNMTNISEFSKYLEENSTKLGYNETEMRKLIDALKDYQAVMDEITGTQSTIEGLQFDIEDLGYDIKDEVDNIAKEAEEKAKEAAEKVKEEMAKALEIFNAKVDIEVNIEDAWRQFNELEKRVQGLKDFDIFGNALLDYKNALTFLTANPNSYFGDAGGGSIQILTQHVNDIMGEINTMQAGGSSSLYGKDQSAAFGDLENYYNQLMSQVNAFYDKLDEVRQAYGQMIDEVISKNDELISDISTIGGLLDHGANLTKLLYGDDSYEELKEYYKQSAENSKELLDESVRRKDYYKELLATINPEKNPDEYEKVKSAYISAMDDIYKYGEELIKKFQDELANAVKASNKQAREDLATLAGFSSPEMQDQDWEVWQYNDDKYLDPTNTEYEMTSLSNKFNEAINDTDSLKAKEKLKDVMQEQLDILQQQLDEGQKLTQYDIDRANKIYELTLRQIALEEAQQNKSKTRLRRDSQGNYRYEFVSDDDAIQDATQDLLDAQNDLYNFDKEHTIELQNEIMEQYQEYAAKVEEIANNHNLSEEQRQEMLAVLYQQYYGEEGILTGLAAEYEDTRHNLAGDTDEEITISNDTMTDSIVQNWNDIAANEQERIKEMIDAVHEEEEQISEANAVISEGYGDIDEGIQNNIGSMEELIAVDNELLEGYEEELDAIEDLLASLEALEAQYKSVMDAALAAIDAALRLRQTSWDSGEESESGDGTGSDSSSDSSGGSNPTTLNTEPAVSRQKVSLPGWVSEDGKHYAYDQASYNALPEDKKKKWRRMLNDGQWKSAWSPNTTKAEFRRVRGDQYKGYKGNFTFDTGGYTGEWGPEGRMAVLHQKELVLNQNDTSNMLQMVKAVRGFDNITNKISESLDKMVLNVLSSIYKNQINTSEQFKKFNNTTDLNQDVKIEANFPSVKSASEIEEALNNLVNLASQKALKSRR